MLRPGAEQNLAAVGTFVATPNFINEAEESARILSKRTILIESEMPSRKMARYSFGCRVDGAIFFRQLDADLFSIWERLHSWKQVSNLVAERTWLIRSFRERLTLPV